MLACQWHFDIPFGTQKEALEILKQYGEAIEKSGAMKPVSERISVGHIGPSPSHVVVESVVESLSDWEKMMQEVGTGKFQEHATKIAKYIVPGSQRWEIYRIVK
jgi:hypothetical protein